MHVEFIRTFEDYKTAINAHRGGREKWKRRLLIALLLILGGLYLSDALFFSPKHDWKRTSSSLFIFTVLLLAINFSAERELRRRWRGQPNLHLHQRWEFTELGIKTDDGTTTSEMQWTAFRTYRDEPKLFMLYTSEFFFHIVPKRAFANDEDVEVCRDLLHQNIQPRTHGFPIAVPVEVEEIS